MPYGVTGKQPTNNGPRLDIFVFENQSDAQVRAEKLLKDGWQDIVVWKQFAIPSLTTAVKWEEVK